VETVGGRVPVVCGIYSEDERDAADKAKDAATDGADALLVMPPNSLAYEDSLDRVVRQFTHIAAAVPLPLVVFVYPQWTGMHYSPELLARLCANRLRRRGQGVEPRHPRPRAEPGNRSLRWTPGVNADEL